MAEHNSRSAQRRSRAWGGWLLPVLLLLAAVAAYWAIRHIEKQVLTAAPSMLEQAGIDSTGLKFDADYRNVTVSGQLPEGASALQVRSALEQGRGANGEDIRKAVVVASGQQVMSPTNIAGTVSADKEPPVVVEPVSTASDPRVNILLAGKELMLSGSDVSKGQAELLLKAATTAVGSANVKQQWQAEQLPDAIKPNADTDNTNQVDALAKLVAALGEHATAANITLENRVIRGSIEAKSELAKESLSAFAGDGVVITSAVFSDKPDQLVAQNSDAAAGSGAPVVDAVISAGSGAADTTETSGAKHSGADSQNVVDDINAIDETDISDKPANDSEAASVNETASAADAASIDETASTDDAAGVDESVTEAAANQEVETEDETSDSEESVVPGEIALAADAGDEKVAESSKVDNEDATLRQEISALQLEIDALQQLISDDVFFVHDSSAVTREALPTLDGVASAIKRYRKPGVVIAGHTDSLASRVYNLNLSRHRASSILQYLVQQGVDAKRLRSEGYGEDRPIGSNRTKQERRLNRRVEFIARKPFAEGE